ncbi:MAG: YfcC family protein [Sedimentibacter sp.]
MTKNEIKATKKEFPHVFVILLAIIFIVTILTYIVPAGTYVRVLNEATNRMVIDPASFTYIARTPVNLFEMFVSIVEGLIQASNITFLIFSAFSCLYLIEKTGALDASIALMVKKTKSNPKYSTAVIIVTMSVLSIWSSTGTMSYEEIIAFIPIFGALCIAMGYDALVALGISLLPVGVGFSSATVNPFSIGVAQTIAELPIFSGIGYRILVLVVMTSVTIAYVLLYANKIKKDPSKSLVAGIDFSDLAIDDERMKTPFTTQRKASILILFGGIAVMAFGLIKLKWYINEIAAIFIIISILVGIANKWDANKITTTLAEGLSKGVVSALVVGIARGILVVLTKGNIIDTIIFTAAGALQNLSLYTSSVGMLVMQNVINFLIPSASGQAAATMPIMVPIADLIGIKRQIAVLIFQFGDGYSNILWPTGFVLIACAMAKVPLNKYYKWILPYFGITFILQIAFVFGAIAINYGPF